MSFNTSNKDWHDEWFYHPDAEKSLGEYSSEYPTPCDSWKAKLTKEELLEVAPLMKKIAELKQSGLTDIWVARHFLKYRLNPLKDRVHPTFEYTGHHDPTRESEVDLEEEVDNKLQALFVDGVDITTEKNKPRCRSYHIYRPPPRKVVKNSNAKDTLLSVLAHLVEEGENVRDELAIMKAEMTKSKNSEQNFKDTLRGIAGPDPALIEAKKRAEEQVLKLQAELTWLQGDNKELIKEKDSTEKKLAHAITLNVKSHELANYNKDKLETLSKKHEASALSTGNSSSDKKRKIGFLQSS
uniref:Uncharacterized protein n=1 Tax=Leersia perrieri TaxID=77586 RepID=A0A0D9WQM8_9ORYZ